MLWKESEDLWGCMFDHASRLMFFLSEKSCRDVSSYASLKGFCSKQLWANLSNRLSPGPTTVSDCPWGRGLERKPPGFCSSVGLLDHLEFHWFDFFGVP